MQHIRGLALALAAFSLADSSTSGPIIHHHAVQGSGFHRGHSMRAMLSMSAAVVQSVPAQTVPLLTGLGALNFPITTANPEAQRYFTQGLAFSYGFNHAAAIASFREAQRLDPACALCWWGEAFAYGPNINAPMDGSTNAPAFGAAAHANFLARNTTAVERALAAAMLKRYSLDPKADRAALDASFADAMLEAAAAYPSHDDLALLGAEAAMNTTPWDYWAPNRNPKERIGIALRLVETVMARNPDHPQAAHLYIHLMKTALTQAGPKLPRTG
jgi:hypothetical protein